MAIADEAMRIVNEELLPVLDRLSDRRPVTTLFDELANMRVWREHLDDAMRTLTERLVPVYERLGDMRSATLARKQVAEMLEVRDKIDEKLRVYHRDTPVFETLEDACAALVALAKKTPPKICVEARTATGRKETGRSEASGANRLPFVGPQPLTTPDPCWLAKPPSATCGSRTPEGGSAGFNAPRAAGSMPIPVQGAFSA